VARLPHDRCAPLAITGRLGDEVTAFLSEQVALAWAGRRSVTSCSAEASESSSDHWAAWQARYGRLVKGPRAKSLFRGPHGSLTGLSRSTCDLYAQA
jgi:hypothetical protein